jgi:transglutaminase-like putative cysteine protease
MFAVFSLVFPALLQAQFQQPSEEELKMTADPKAPGAAAVYLNIEEVTDDSLSYHSFYARIKVLQEQGKELATIELPYEHGFTQVTDIKARTIHSDGTVIPLPVKPEDLLSTKVGEAQFNRKVFTLPSVEVGSILEYRYELHYSDHMSWSPDWEIQRPYFVHTAHYKFTPFRAFLTGWNNSVSQVMIDRHGKAINSIIWWPQLPPGVEVKTDSVGRFSVDLNDIPAAPHEEWMPPADSFLYHVAFYYKSAFTGNEYWMSEAKYWSSEVDRLAEAKGTIKQAVAGIIAPGDSDLDKAKKIYKAVQALDNTAFSRRKGDAELKQLGLHIPNSSEGLKSAEDTWTQKSGSPDEIALLYLSMARAAGLTAYAMRIVDRERGVFTPGYLNFDQLNDDIVILVVSGMEITLDPGERMCPFGMVRWNHTGAGGIRQGAAARAAAFSPTQPYTANTLRRVGDITLDDHGAATGSIRFVMTGQEALVWRQSALELDEDETKKQFDRWLETMVPQGVEAHIDHFQALDDPDTNLVAFVKLQGPLGTSTSKRILLPAFFFETRGLHPFVNQEKRLVPVDMHNAEQVTDQIVYHLPPNFAVEGAPQDIKVPWGDRGLLNTRTIPAAGQITIARQFTRGFIIVKPEDYQDLRGFYQKVAAADQQQLVLTSSAAAKSN